jgi:peptidoglycan/LPS O-acetylase OafA/YrhL
MPEPEQHHQRVYRRDIDGMRAIAVLSVLLLRFIRSRILPSPIAGFVIHFYVVFTVDCIPMTKISNLPPTGVSSVFLVEI